MGTEEQGRITIRGVDPETWKQTRIKAVELGIPAGQIVTEALRDWLQKAGTRG